MPQQPKSSDQSLLLQIASRYELFRDAGGGTFATFVAIRPSIFPHRETWPLNSPQFAQHLSGMLFAAHRKAPQPTALTSVIDTLKAKAQHEGSEQPVFRRVAEHEGAIYLDLCNNSWETIRITKDGWERCSEAPVRFIRTNGMEPLPRPECGGDLDELRRFVNVAPGDWPLFLAWLTMCLRPRGPYPLLLVHGGEGSAKTTLSRVVRTLIDPNTAALRSMPNDERTFMISATNAWLVVFDNVSSMSHSQSDMLCRLATGGSFAVRELYSDTGETLLSAQRPVLLNGITPVATRPDLLDRAVALTLPRIADDKRQPEATFSNALEEARSRMFGAILDAMVGGMRELPLVSVANLPRMADFALWGAALERALKWPTGSFAHAYDRNQTDGIQDVLESDPLATAVIQIAERGSWEGTATELLDHLIAFQGPFPPTAQKLSNALSRQSGALRRVGVIVERPPRQENRRPIRIRRVDSMEVIDGQAA